MNPRLKASRAAIELIKRFEGFRSDAAQLSDGGWTIGYGHTKTARQGAAVSQSDAEALLLYDLQEIQAAINDAVFTPLSQNQFDALAAFAFNVGVDNFRNSSVLRRINEGNLVQAACAIEMWRKADLGGERIVVDALVRRRSAEKTLFLTPAGGWAAAPSAIVRPRVDYEVAASLPRTSAEAAYGVFGGVLTAHRADEAGPQDAPAVFAAAEAITARLQALNLAEADAGIDLAPSPPAPVEDEDLAPDIVATQPEETEPRFELTPEPEASVETTPLQEASPPIPAQDQPQLFEDAIPAGASRRIVRREASTETKHDPYAGSAPEIGAPALMGLGLGGLAVFVSAVLWGVNAKGSGGVLDPMVVASVFGLIGVGLVASAVYFLLVKLGGRGD